MQLAQSIKDSYYQHLSELPLGKQIHFCTRLAAWEGDKAALDYLRTLRPMFVPTPFSEDKMRDSLRTILIGPATGEPNAFKLRKPYFDKYPSLRTVDNTLFRVRHLLTVYGVDTRPLLLGLIAKEQLIQLKEQLFADDQAMRILSTYAINLIYLLERVVFDNTGPDAINLDRFYTLGQSYNVNDRDQLQLYVYFYTHCIIGETNFYIRPIPQELLPAYRQMVADLEAVMTERYNDIHLDNKLEFLVCRQIVGHQSTLANRIYAECEKSVSDDGHFLVDRHNANAQSHYNDIATSEHRNVLYIMSHSPYSPHTTLVG